LRAIDGFARILVEDYRAALPEEAQHHLDRVRESTQDMDHLIDDMLAFARLSRLPLKLQRVLPGPLVQHVIDDLAEERKGRNVDIRLGDLPVCQADPGLLQHVFENLLSNAIKFTRQCERAVIEIGATKKDDEPRIVTFFVKDNGVGFDAQYAEKAFGVFQRLHKAEEYEGTGVGLAIVHRIINRHGGRVWADAEVNKGATFFFTLPAGDEQATSSKHQTTEVTADGGGPELGTKHKGRKPRRESGELGESADEAQPEQNPNDKARMKNR
jgi:light-regulated signal transduction histidine kinase (bacteriophytochrome)